MPRSAPRPSRRLRRARRYPGPPRPGARTRPHLPVVASIFALVLVFGAGLPGSAPPTATTTTALAAAPAAPEAEPVALSARSTPLTGASVPLTVVAPPVSPDHVLVAAMQLREEVGEARENLDEEQEAEAAATLASRQEDLPIIYEHEVQAGETVTSIAALYGVSTDHIIWNNIDILTDADTLAIGIVLQVPSLPGIIHSVRIGDTVSEIAETYDTTIEAIVEFRANGFNGNPDNLPEGSLILVPGGRIVPPAPEPDPVVDPAPTPAPDPPPASSPPRAEPTPAPTPAARQGLPAAGEWLWPARGRITNRFTPRHPLGIDVSMIVGTPLVASAPGRVVFAGGNPCCSYGLHIIIEHGSGYESLYAHLSEFAVRNGQWVEAGQRIGRSGNTGRSTGPHLHFEIRRNGVHQDPMRFLQ